MTKTQGKNSRVRQVYQRYLTKTGRICKPVVDPISVSTIALILLMPFARRDIFYNSVFPILVTIEN